MNKCILKLPLQIFNRLNKCFIKLLPDSLPYVPLCTTNQVCCFFKLKYCILLTWGKKLKRVLSEGEHFKLERVALTLLTDKTNTTISLVLYAHNNPPAVVCLIMHFVLKMLPVVILFDLL